MSVTTYEKSFSASFSVDDKFFKRLEGLAPNPLKATVELSDGATIDQLSISDLLDLPNPRSRQILRVNVTTSDYLARPKLEVSLGRVFAPISYSITGDDKTASYLSTQLDRLLRDHVHWYSWINHMPDWLKLALFQLLTIGGLVTIFVGALGLKSGDQVLVTPSVVVPLLGALMLCAPEAYMLRKMIFPEATFRIGDGVTRANSVENLRRTFFSIILVVIVLGLLVHVFGTGIARYFLGEGH